MSWLLRSASTATGALSRFFVFARPQMFAKRHLGTANSVDLGRLLTVFLYFPLGMRIKFLVPTCTCICLTTVLRPLLTTVMPFVSLAFEFPVPQAPLNLRMPSNFSSAITAAEGLEPCIDKTRVCRDQGNGYYLTHWLHLINCIHENRLLR